MNPAPTPRRGFRRKVAISLLVSGGLLAFILSRIDLSGLLAALERAAPLGLGLALASLGLGILAGSFRWRVGLSLAGVPMKLPVQLRASYAGHAFNLMLLGPAGGDVAKTALYSRWYGLSLTDLIASAIIDRSLSVVGSLLFIVVTIGLFLGSSLSFIPGSLEAEMPDAGWLLLVLLLLLGAAGGIYRLRHHPFLRQLGKSLRGTLRSARERPSVLLRGGLLGLLGQVFMSAVMALALWSVTEADVAWRDILWTFPLITSLAALPASVGGAGIREGAAILLLTRFGIPAEDLVAAGLINLLVQLAWGLVGGAVILREWREQGRAPV